MTAKEIIENEWECVRRADDGECDRECEKCDLVMPTIDILVAYDIACDALDKQIPKKPKFFGTGNVNGDYIYDLMCCPCCEEVFYDGRVNYCPSCGNKLDWEEDK